MATVNIILASYNGEKYLEEQLDSIMNMDFKDFVLHVCDDCSKDSTCDIVRRYIDKYPGRIKLYVNESNMGSTGSFLFNLKRVAAESPSLYYMFSDQDDVWLSDKINISLAAISKIERRHRASRPALVFNDALIVNDKLEYVSRSFYKTDRLKVHKTGFSRMLMENKCIGCTMMMNRALVDMVSGPHPDIRYHDWWVALVASAFGYVKFVKTPTIMYRQHQNNQVGQTGFTEYAKSRTGKKEDVRVRLTKTYRQAAHFKEVYYDRLRLFRRHKLDCFCKLETAGFFKRRYLVLRYRFFKSGFIRNIGLMFYL